MPNAFRIGDSDDRHVFGQPAFVSRLGAGHSQRMAFAAQNRVAPETRADAPNRPPLGEMTHKPALGGQIPETVNAAREASVVSEAGERDLTHPREHPQTCRHVGTVGELDTDAAAARPERAQHVRHDVHRPALHRAAKQRPHVALRFVRIRPLIGGPGIDSVMRADERRVLRRRGVGRTRANQNTARKELFVQPECGAVSDHPVLQRPRLERAAVTPANRVGLGVLGN